MDEGAGSALLYVRTVCGVFIKQALDDQYGLANITSFVTGAEAARA